MAYIISRDSNDNPLRVEIEDELTIGRHPSCDIVLEEVAVSRQHAKIYRRDGYYLLEDLDSRNGTYLNQRLISRPTRLLDGDQITICENDLSFQLHDTPVSSQKPRTTATDDSNLASSVLIEDSQGRDVPSIMSQMEVASHHDSASSVSRPQARLGALITITQSLSKAIGLEQVLPTVLDCLFDMFHQADRGFVVMDDPVRGLQPLGMKVRREQDDESIRISRTIVRHVLESQQAIISADAAADSRFDLSQSISDFRIRSLMCAPLIDSDGHSIGVIQLDTLRNAVGFSDEDLEILATVAMQTGLAIENVKLHEKELRQQALERDLELAHEVQHRLIPQQPPSITQYKFYDYYQPAAKVGGDFFDYVVLSDGAVAVLIADVVGHGVAAALLMAKFSAEARYALATSESAAEAMNKLNQSIAGLQLDRFITVLMAILHPETHRLTIVNAGHMPPVLRHACGNCEQLGIEASGLPIGILDEYEYRQKDLELKAGDSLTFYTDGISEATSPDEEMFGNRRIVETVQRSSDGTASAIGETVVRELKQYTHGAHASDDICLVILARQTAEE